MVLEDLLRRSRELTPYRRPPLGLELDSNDINVVKDWLGHADLNTTHGYVEIDMKDKRKALEACQPPQAQPLPPRTASRNG